MEKEDTELIEMLNMEACFKKACEIHEQYTTHVIFARMEFQRNCPHTELKVSDYFDSIGGGEFELYTCIRCGKLVTKKEKVL